MSESSAPKQSANVEKLQAIIDLARQANAPASIHDRCLALARELAAFIESAEAAAAVVPVVDAEPISGPGARK